MNSIGGSTVFEKGGWGLLGWIFGEGLLGWSGGWDLKKGWVWMFGGGGALEGGLDLDVWGRGGFRWEMGMGMVRRGLGLDCVVVDFWLGFWLGLGADL